MFVINRSWIGSVLGVDLSFSCLAGLVARAEELQLHYGTPAPTRSGINPYCPCWQAIRWLLQDNRDAPEHGRHPTSASVRSALTIRPLLQHSQRISGFPGVSRRRHPSHRSRAQLQVPRTQREVPLIPWPQVPASATPPHNQRHPDLTINRPRSCAPSPLAGTTAEQANARGPRSGLCCVQTQQSTGLPQGRCAWRS